VDRSCYSSYIGSHAVLISFFCTECAAAVNPCGPNSIECINEPGTWGCRCQSGYEDVNGFCADINECLEGLDNCDEEKEVCQNEIGGYRCECGVGYIGQTPNCADIDGKWLRK